MQTRISRWVVAGLAVLFLARLAMAAPASATDEVAKDKAVFQQKLQEIKQACVPAKNDVLARYRKTLDATRLVDQQRGDLDAVTAVDAEIKRFEQKKTISSGTPRSASAELVKAIKGCREALEQVDEDAAQKVIDCTDRFLLFLDQRKKQAVRDDNLGLAKAYDVCIKGIKDTPEYQEARFLMHERRESGVANNNKPASELDTKGKDAAAGGGDTSALLVSGSSDKHRWRQDPKGLYDAERIYDASAAPSLSTSTTSSYRPLVVSDTGKAPLSGGIGIALDGLLDDTNARYQLRIKLRTKTSSASFSNLKVIAQYFAKGFNNSPIQEAAKTHFVFVPALGGGKNITCELQPIDLPYAQVYQYWVAPYSYVKQGSFVGVIVSVYSLDDKLLGQVTSSSGIKDKGKPAFELPGIWVFTEKTPRDPHAGVRP